MGILVFMVDFILFSITYDFPKPAYSDSNILIFYYYSLDKEIF